MCIRICSHRYLYTYTSIDVYAYAYVHVPVDVHAWPQKTESLLVLLGLWLYTIVLAAKLRGFGIR